MKTSGKAFVKLNFYFIRHYIPRLCFLALILLSQHAGFSQEEILSYHVTINISNEDKIKVVEKIKVRSEADRIKRGIYRTIPTIRPDESGKNEAAPVHFLYVKKNGNKESSHTESATGGVTLYIGNRNTLLSPGIYEYEFAYEAQNQIGFFENYDELYWNITGNDWDFNIESYSAEIHLPDSAQFLQGSCYTGRIKSTDSNCRLTVSSDSSIVYLESTSGLHPGEGATIAVAWPKGHVTNNFAPGSSGLLGSNNYSGGNYAVINPKSHLKWINFALYFSSCLLFLYFAIKWWKKVGVDPPSRAIVPRWEPPGNFSPADLHYIFKHRISNSTISAALVHAAIKGAIKIENKKKKFTFTKLSDEVTLEPEEQALIDELFRGSSEFKLTKSTHSRYLSGLKEFSISLKNKIILRDYFRYNWKYLSQGTLLFSFLITLSMSIGKIPLAKNYVISFLLSILLLSFFYIMISLVIHIRHWVRWIILIPALIISGLIFTAIFSNALFLISNFYWIFLLFSLSALIIGLYNYFIVAPTEKGQQVTSEIKGFKMYLKKAEKDLLNYFTPPEKTPELFEKMLPFAIALGVENKWADKFESVLNQAIEEGTYSPVWYVGNIHQLNRIDNNFQSAVSAAAPKSSSGSSGGGFSGGGGGGGGGGGW